VVPQKREKREELRRAVMAKLEKVRCLDYIQPGTVQSLISYFAVPKGESDIQIVHDGTKSGLNDAMWAPWFSLPSIETHLRCVDANSFLGDIDVGYMFHNFMLHGDLQAYAGIDLTPFFQNKTLGSQTPRTVWERWVRSAMGFKSSPYNAIQGMLFGEEVIRGDPMDKHNIFRWSHVRLNLPGSKGYITHLPWVSKVRDRDGKLACDLVCYVDDLRSSGNSWSEARSTSRAIGSKLNWLGIQEAARKRRDPCQDPGPWAWSLVVIDPGKSVMLSVTHERWIKTKEIIGWIQEEINTSDTIEFKTLERHQGFLIYMSCTYNVLTPYLKGIHLTLDSWRPWQKDDGWKMTMSKIQAALAEKGSEDQELLRSGGKSLERVKWVPRLKDDIRALSMFTDTKEPPNRVVRPNKSATVVYSFGDASGSGFGSSFKIGEEIRYLNGQWNEDHGSKSSNYRELANLVYSLEIA
jgi:hypothetical protein